MMHPEKLYNTAEISNELRKRGIYRTKETLAQLRLNGGGPTFRRFGREIKYSGADLEQWINEKFSQSARSLAELRKRTPHETISHSESSAHRS